MTRATCTMSKLTFRLLLCRCQYVSTTSNQKDLQYAVGHEPEDEEAMFLRYCAGLKQLPVAALLSGAPKRKPFGPLTKSLKDLFRDLGVRVVTIQVVLLPDNRPCMHP